MKDRELDRAMKQRRTTCRKTRKEGQRTKQLETQMCEDQINQTMISVKEYLYVMANAYYTAQNRLKIGSTTNAWKIQEMHVQ